MGKQKRTTPFYKIKLKEIKKFKEAKLTNNKEILNFEIHICACELSKQMPICDASYIIFCKDKKIILQKV